MAPAGAKILAPVRVPKNNGSQLTILDPFAKMAPTPKIMAPGLLCVCNKHRPSHHNIDENLQPKIMKYNKRIFLDRILIIVMCLDRSSPTPGDLLTLLHRGAVII